VDYDTSTKEYRSEESLVLAGALNDLSTPVIKHRLCFPEAGPRKRLSYSSTDDLTVGILVSGGIAPGINAVVAGIVERHNLYKDKGGGALTIKGYQNGLNAIYRRGDHSRSLTKADVEARADRGGSILGTSRLEDFVTGSPAERRAALRQAVDNLSTYDVKILYIIGGDGSMRAAHAIWRTARDLGRDISIIGIPKTMDNDVLWMWQSFGFLSAVQRSRDLIQELHTEAKSNPRLCVIQLFGSDSGFVVTHAISAIGVCDLFLIPEVPFTMTKLCDYIRKRLKERYKPAERQESPHAMVVMAETAIPRDAEEYFDLKGIGLSENEKDHIRTFLKQKRVAGQTPDELRSGGLKLVSGVIQNYINENKKDFFEPYWRNFRVFTNEPRHQIRATAPSSSDTIIAKRLGTLAVDGAIAGYDDFMISQWLTEYVMVPLRLVILGRKRIPRDGVFYRSAIASTGQPAKLD
jgi:6-phosphofructokinase 1